MPKKATGHYIHHANGYSARVRVGSGRPSIPLAVRRDDEAEVRAKLLVDMAKRLRSVVPDEELIELLTIAGKARTEKRLREAVEAVDAIASGGTTRIAAALSPTFADFAKQWTSGELHQKFPDHVKSKKTSERDAELLALYILPHVEIIRLPDFSLEDAERVMSALPAIHPKTGRPLKAGTRRYVAQTTARVLVLACYPGKHIATSPIPRGWLPKVNKTLAKECLYPDEDRLLMVGKSVETGKVGPLAAVPLLRRLVYGFLAREGMRTDELARLKWRDLDLERNRVKLDENKTDDPRDWDMQPGTLGAMQLWKKNFCPEAKGDDRVFAENGVPLNVEHLADQLRRDLRRVGVTRHELFERSAVRQPIRAHDLRATFVTVSLAIGKGERWVKDRTGHRNDMVETYREGPEFGKLKSKGASPRFTRRSRSCDKVIGHRLDSKSSARVAKLADAADLGSAAARRKGSTPFPCT